MREGTQSGCSPRNKEKPEPLSLGFQDAATGAVRVGICAIELMSATICSYCVPMLPRCYWWCLLGCSTSNQKAQAER